jgi:iron-sulfur cluster insertion protein
MIDIKITDEAISKIKQILEEENKPDLKLRVGVQGGGCAGFSYFFTLDEEQSDDDWSIESNGVQLLVDTMSGEYLKGSTVDYREDIHGSTFVITGMEAATTCGCSSSFSPY